MCGGGGGEDWEGGGEGEEDGSMEGAAGTEQEVSAGEAVEEGGRLPAATKSTHTEATVRYENSSNHARRRCIRRLCVCCALTEPRDGVEFAFQQCQCDFHSLDVLLDLSQLVFTDCVELVQEVHCVDNEAVHYHQHLPTRHTLSQPASRSV